MYCGRVSIDLSNANAFIDAYLEKYPTLKFIACYEEKDKTGDKEAKYVGSQNPHIHFMAEYKDPKDGTNKQRRSEFMKQWKPLCPHGGQQYYHKECESIDKALAYTIKDGHILKQEGFTKIQLDEALLRNDNIEEDKKLNSLMKLNKRFIEWNKKEKIEEITGDDFRKRAHVRLFVLEVYTKEYGMEISTSRVNSLANQLILLNGIISRHDMIDMMSM